MLAASVTALVRFCTRFPWIIIILGLAAAIGAATYAQIRAIAVVRELGGIAVKGKAAPVEAFVLLGLRQTSVEHDAAEEYRT